MTFLPALTNERINKLGIKVALVVNAVIVALVALNAIDWSVTETGLMVAAITSVVVLVATSIAHFQKGTTKEWSTIGLALTAAVVSVCAALNTLGVTHLDNDQITALTGIVAVVFGLGAMPSVRARTTPWPKNYPYPEGGPINTSPENPAP